MRIIHCADMHLDSALKTSLYGEKIKERRAEIFSAFSRMNDYASENNVDAIIIAGDMFDTKNPYKKTKDMVYDIIIKHSDIQYFYLKGNHEDNVFIDYLLQRGDIPDNFHYFKDTWTSFDIGNVTINGLVMANADKNTVYSSLSLREDRYNIVVLHGQESDYSSSSKDEIINVKELAHKSIDYLALGHIHKYKQAKLDVRGIYAYCGCLEGRGFDETGEKGFLILDITEENKMTGKFIDIAKRHIYSIPVDISNANCAGDIEELIKAAASNIEYKNMLEIKLTGAISARLQYDLESIKQSFQNYYAFRIKDDEVKLAVNVEDYCNEVSLKGEFVRMMMNSDQYDEEMRNHIIMMGLKAINGEEI